MNLYIGGYAQGKLDYAASKHPKAKVFDEKNIDELEAYEGVCLLNHFHLLIRQMIYDGKTTEQVKDYVENILSYDRLAAIICDEIGNGIVPLEKEERLYRETTGRMMTLAAAKAEKVERILCGIPQRIK